MKSETTAASAEARNDPGLVKLLEQYGCGPIQFTGKNDALVDEAQKIVNDTVAV